MDNRRRTFLGICLAGCASVVAATFSWPLFRYLAPDTANDMAEKVVIHEKDIPEGEAKFFEYAGSSAVIVRKRDGGIVVLSAVCTHLGCIVQWKKDKQDFLCPCHGGRFNTDGIVTAGPPPKSLSKIPFSVDGATITVG